jgi:hypothetical protein
LSTRRSPTSASATSGGSDREPWATRSRSVNNARPGLTDQRSKASSVC